MKTKLLKLALCAMALMPMGAWAEYKDATEDTYISSETTWTFDDVTSSFTSALKDLDGLILKAYTDGITPTSISTKNINIGGKNLNVTSYITIPSNTTMTPSAGAWSTRRYAYTNATTTNSLFGKSMAFNTSVPGICYVYMSGNGNTESRNNYIIFQSVAGSADATGISGDNATTTTASTYNTETVIKYTATTSGTFHIAFGNGAKIYAVRFVPLFSLTTSVSPDNSGLIETSVNPVSSNLYAKGTEITLTATPADGYIFSSWTGVDSFEGATAAVTMNSNKEVTANFTKAAVVTKWIFEEYMPGHNLFGSSTSRDAMEFTDGLYLHTRDADAANYKVEAVDLEIANDATDFSSQTKTYSHGGTYSAITIRSGNSHSGSHATLPGQKVDADGISYQAPAAGTFYATIYASTATTFYTYQNSTTTYTTTSFSAKEGKDIKVSVESGDVIYICNYGTGSAYLLEAMFVPTTPESTHTTVTFKSVGGGYATFSSTKNYTVPTGVTAYYVSSVDDTENKAVMTSIDAGSVIPACTGVILYKDGVTTEDVTVQMSTADKTNAVDNQLRANIVAYELPASGDGKYNYTLAYESSNPVFKHVASTDPGILAGGKAFLRTTVNVPGGGSSRSINLVFDEDETTGIETVKVQKEEVTNGEYYDLMGRRVTNPTKGLYIVNGKKVFIK